MLECWTSNNFNTQVSVLGNSIENYLVKVDRPTVRIFYINISDTNKCIIFLVQTMFLNAQFHYLLFNMKPDTINNNFGYNRHSIIDLLILIEILLLYTFF